MQNPILAEPELEIKCGLECNTGADSSAKKTWHGSFESRVKVSVIMTGLALGAIDPKIG